MNRISHRSKRRAVQQLLQVQAIALDVSESISRHDRDIVLFALKWLPFGGPNAENIWLEFGMTTDRYLDRLVEFVNSPEVGKLHHATARELRRFVSARDLERRIRNKKH